jgi:hypothetical protein
MVCGRPRLMLATAHNSHDVHHTRVICSLVVATITIGRGHDLPRLLLAPLLAALGALPGVLDGSISRHFPVVAQGRLKLGCLIAGDVLGGDTVQLPGGVPDCISWCLEG